MSQTFPEALYIHIPFCGTVCNYCDFAREIYSPSQATGYLGALGNELRVRCAELSAAGLFAPRTIFIGGGTPSVLPLELWTALLSNLRQYVDLTRVVEFTTEANPGSADSGLLEFLRAQGVNRISFGVQSFQPHLLKLLGRGHDASAARAVVQTARAAGFSHIALDLLHGVPTQTRDDLRRDLDEALALDVEHISAYGLTYEQGTPLARAVAAGVVAPLGPEAERDQYLDVIEHLEGAGMPQYEISNYARAQAQARHNLIYWRNEAYLGIGVAAASFIQFERSVNLRTVEAYVRRANQTGHAVLEREILSAQARAREALVLELRLRRGIAPDEFLARWGLDPRTLPALEKFVNTGLVERTAEGRYRITRSGLPVADGILSELV